MTRKLAPLTKVKQIEEAASKWDHDLVAIWDKGNKNEGEEDRVHVAYKRPILVPLEAAGMVVFMEMEEPFATVDTDTPISEVMKQRRRFWETNTYADYVAARVAREKAEKAKLEAVDHELKADLRKLYSGRIQVGLK